MSMIAGAMNIFALIIFIAAIVALIRFFRPRSEDHQQISRKKQPAAILTGDEDVLIKPSPVEARIWAKEDAEDQADGMVLKIPSYNETGTVYICNLRRVRCSCQDWLKRRNFGND